MTSAIADDLIRGKLRNAVRTSGKGLCRHALKVAEIESAMASS